MTKLRDLKTSIRRRFEFIEFQLTWAGEVGRKKLQDQFEISPQQATNDLTTYMDAYPGNMSYDPRRKSYVPGSEFEPQLTEGEASEYLMHIDMLHRQYRDQSEIWVKDIPSFDAVGVHSRKIAQKTLKAVVRAIQKQEWLQARYISLASGNTGRRTLLPHAIASDSHRWHMRAFDFENARYSDFVLSRFDNLKVAEPPTKNVPKDVAWNSNVEVIFIADPSLEAARRERLELEYGMRKGELRLKVRQAMLFYFLRFYGFDALEMDGSTLRNKSSFHLYLKNLDEVESCLGRR